MVNVVKVNLGKRTYPIIIGSGILAKLGHYLKSVNPGADAFIITNAWLKNKYGTKLGRVLAKAGIEHYFKLVPDGEKAKSMAVAAMVIRDLARFDQRRKVFVIALGGGVIGDLSGFVASVYKRGINYIQIPTTLLAQVDSAIGGKTALDLDRGKNLVGAFYQPRLVLSDVSFLSSLSLEQFGSGMAEVIKYALIRDPRLFNLLKRKSRQILGRQSRQLQSIILACSRIKAKIVSRDEKETLGLRSVLNFGHTVGHAIEAAGGYRGYNHGQAVGLGMIAAVELSALLGLTNPANALRLRELLKVYGLPVKIKNTPLAKVLKAHYYDKKFSGKENKFILIGSIGQTRIVRNVKLELIKAAIARIY